MLDMTSDSQVTMVRLDRAGRRNALDGPLVEALHNGMDAVSTPFVVLSSTDPKAFSAGADLDMADDARAAVSDRLYALYQAMRAHPATIIAAIDGPAVGAGAQLAVASDLRIASSRAWLRFPGVSHGLAVGAWGLPSLVGRGRAGELCLSMRRVEASEALRIGLVDRLTEDPVADALALVRARADAEPGVLTRVKRIVGIVDPDEALALERSENVRCWDGAAPPKRPAP